MLNAREDNDQAFLLKLSDTLRAETGAEAVGNRATQLIAQQLGADRVYLVTLNPDNDTVLITHETRRQDMPPLRGSYRSSDFPAAIKELFERTIVYADVNTDARLTELDCVSFAGLGAVGFIASSIRRGSEIMIWAAGALSTRPRSWTASEVTLFEDAIERTWAAVERARAEEALTKSEERLQLATTAAQIGTFIYYPKEDRGEPDAQMLRLYGLPPDDTLNLAKSLAELLYPDDRDRYASDVAQALNPSGIGKLDSDIRIVHPDGSLHWINVRGQVVFENGQAIRMPGVSTDITERKHKEANLAFLADVSQDLAQLTDITQTMNALGEKIGTYLGLSACAFAELHQGTQPGMLTAVINHGWHRGNVPSLLGTYRMEEFMTPEVMQLCLAGKAVIIRDVFKDTRTDGEQYAALDIGSFVSMPLVREGQWRFLLIIYRREPHDWSQEEIELTRELTTRIWTRLEHSRVEEALRLEDQRKDEFLAMLAHELRNPMSTIRSGLQILTLTAGKDAISSDTIAMMNRQTAHLVRLVDELLDVSRISQGKIELKRERLELGQLVLGALEAIRPQYTTVQKQLHFSPSPAELFVNGDSTRLSQVVTNLATNGLRYTGELGQVWVSLQAQQGEAVLRVADNGIGLSVDQLTAIFGLFVQVDNSLARSQGGLGIGLTLVKRLVDMHGGRIIANSAGIGQGSEFLVYLPLLEEPS